MKALILERRGPYATALREDGIVVKIRHAGQVGETVELGAELLSFPGGRWGRQLLRTAAAAALAVTVLGGAYGYTAVWACSYVSLETEEVSVELSLNRLGRVVGVAALNESSAELAESLNSGLKNIAAEEALSAAVTELRRSAGDGAVVAGVTDGSEKRAAALTEKVTRAAGPDGEFYAVELTPAERRDAAEHRQGPGHYGMQLRGQELPGGQIPAEPPEGALPTESPRPTDAPVPTEAPAEQRPMSDGGQSVPAGAFAPESPFPMEQENRDEPDGREAPESWEVREAPSEQESQAPQAVPEAWSEQREQEAPEQPGPGENEPGSPAEAQPRELPPGRDAVPEGQNTEGREEPEDPENRDDWEPQEMEAPGNWDAPRELEAPEDWDIPREMELPGDWNIPQERENPEGWGVTPSWTAPENWETGSRPGPFGESGAEIPAEGGRQP